MKVEKAEASAAGDAIVAFAKFCIVAMTGGLCGRSKSSLCVVSGGGQRLWLIAMADGQNIKRSAANAV